MKEFECYVGTFKYDWITVEAEDEKEAKMEAASQLPGCVVHFVEEKGDNAKT